jgi:hypothetical protein
MRGDTLVSCARPRSRARPFRSLAWGDAISRPLVLLQERSKREGTSQKTTVRGLASASSTSNMTITVFLEDFQ